MNKTILFAAAGLASSWLCGCSQSGGDTAQNGPGTQADGGADTLLDPDSAEHDANADGWPGEAGTGDGGVQDAGGGDAAEAGPPPVVQQVSVPRGGVSARFAFEDAYDNVAGGAWYREDDNETATLAWGESYVMMSLAAMFRATGNPAYLDRLAWHADGVLSQRDDRRGVQDYRGISGACWRNTHYQANQEAYCYAVHSGMIASPMADFAVLVANAGLEEELAYDGVTFGQKATDYVAAAEETAAYHDDEWNAAGYYLFRADATFLQFAGQDQPLNQSNAMGRLLLILHDATGKAQYQDKASKLAQRFRAQLATGANGEYLWNYWGGAYSSPGEDISHAAINVEFAVMAAERGIVFTQEDVDAFTRTFLAAVYVDDGTFSDFVGGGSTNGSSYRAQAGRWLPLARTRTSIYAALRDLYEQDYRAQDVGSGSLLLTWAMLAQYEPVHRNAFFYSVDWADPNPGNEGDWRQATAYGANILVTPPDLAGPCVVTLPVDVPRTTDVGQWDGSAYHTLLRWTPTGGQAVRWLGYEPWWPHVYWNDGVLFQFEDTFVDGQGIRVKEMAAPSMPQWTSTAPASAVQGSAFEYAASATGDGPLWWSLVEFPANARVDSMTGVAHWTPPGPGDYPWTIRAQNDFGVADQSFVVHVP